MKKIDTLLDMMDRFPDDNECRKHLEEMLWADGKPICPHCKNKKDLYRHAKRNIFTCSSCKKQFSITTGTIFHGTHVSLRKWFVTIYLFTTHKKSISAHQLAKDIHVTVKTAWHMIHRVRTAIQSKDFGVPMKEKVTVDESMWGQKSRNIHYRIRPKYNQGRKGEHKLKIFTMVEDSGRAKSVLVKDFSGYTLKNIIYNYVEKGTTIQSDEYRGYNGLSNNGYIHIRCDHGRYQYVGETGANTNKCENYYSHMKRLFHGTYHKMTEKHIQKYLDEFDFRYNTRSLTNGERFNNVLALGRVRLTYNQLIGKA